MQKLSDGIAAEFEQAQEVIAAATPQAVLLDVERAVARATEAQAVVDDLEFRLKAAQAELNRLKSVELPELLDRLGLQSVERDKWSIKIDDFVSGNLPKDSARRQAALEKLKSYGAEGLVRVKVAADFSPGESALAAAAVKALRDLGVECEAEATVHAQSLCAFARTRLREGLPLDPDVLGLYVGRVAKIKRKDA